jgi:lambda repressor-like predicted transcriptional regulator
MVSVIFATKNEVIGRLRMAGLNMKQFAVGEGYEPDTVRKVVGRYAGSNRTPRGVLAREILQKLGETIYPGDAEERIHHSISCPVGTP